ncbi:MAG: hypothetical protein AB8F95_00775 [Bacteroidia bacterium]
MKKFFFVSIAFLLCLPLMAQTSSEGGQQYTNKLAVGAGIHQAYMSDRNFSPLRYNESGLMGAFRFESQNDQSHFSIRASYSADSLAPPAIEQFTTYYQMGNFALRYLRKNESLSNSRFQFYWGGQFDFHLYSIDWDYQESFSFLVNYSLDLSARGQYQLNDRGRLQLDLDIPLINFLVRPPYNGLDAELIDNNANDDLLAIITNGSVGSVNKLLAYRLSLAYQYALSDRLDLELIYRNQLHHTFDTNRFIHLQNQLMAGLAFNF